MKPIRAILITATLTYVAITCISYTVSKPLSHDEHQFLASAFMVAQYNHHPYQDFAYFHMPNLVYLYAPLFLLPYPFLLARIFVGIFSIGICFLIFFTAYSLFAEKEKLGSLIIPISITILFVHSPLFEYASSYVWNHSQSVMFAIMAFLFHTVAIRRNNPLLPLFLSGLCLGMAIGIRLTYAPLVAPFLLATMIYSRSPVKEKAFQVMAFSGGGLLANLPTIYFFLTSFDNFIFGIFGYPVLNTSYRQDTSFPRAMTLIGKFEYIKDFVFANPIDLMILIVAVSSLMLLGIEKMRHPKPIRFEIGFLIMLLPFVIMGAFAPTPSWYQYYFAIMPFLILLSLYALASIQRSIVINLLILFISIISFFQDHHLLYKSSILDLLHPGEWYPVRVAQESEIIENIVDSKDGKGAILTLSPIYAIESGLPIYDEFVTGPFAWRVSEMLSDEVADNRGFTKPSRIRDFFETEVPRAVLTGGEKDYLEASIITEAQRLGYQPVETPTGMIVWILP